jgi:hypothetical protein
MSVLKDSFNWVKNWKKYNFLYCIFYTFGHFQNGRHDFQNDVNFHNVYLVFSSFFCNISISFEIINQKGFQHTIKVSFHIYVHCTGTRQGTFVPNLVLVSPSEIFYQLSAPLYIVLLDFHPISLNYNSY